MKSKTLAAWLAFLGGPFGLVAAGPRLVEPLRDLVENWPGNQLQTEQRP